MNRRGFLGALVATALAASADLTKLGRTVSDLMPTWNPLLSGEIGMYTGITVRTIIRLREAADRMPGLRYGEPTYMIFVRPRQFESLKSASRQRKAERLPPYTRRDGARGR